MEKSSEQSKAMSWALRGDHLKVYPITTDKTYSVVKNPPGRKPYKATMNYVKLVIETGNAKHIGKDLYKQDSEMGDKISQIYIHYYNQRKH